MLKAQRREREHHQRRTEILAQAERIFAAKGFRNTSVAEIADASGFAVGTLYQFFPSKEQLHIAMVTERLEAMYAFIQDAVAKETHVVKKIETLVSSLYRFVEDHAEFCSIFSRGDYMSLSEESAELRRQLAAGYAAHIALTEELMGEGIRCGHLKNRDPGRMATALRGIANSFASQWLNHREESSLMGYVPCVMDIFMEGVRKNGH
jgi:AcrR family transcriptional regulator